MDDWYRVRSIPELLQSFGPKENSAARLSPVPGMSTTVECQPASFGLNVRSDANTSSVGASWTDDWVKAGRAATKTSPQKVKSYSLLLGKAPKRSPVCV